MELGSELEYSRQDGGGGGLELFRVSNTASPAEEDLGLSATARHTSCCLLLSRGLASVPCPFLNFPRLRICGSVQNKRAALVIGKGGP